MKRNFWLSRAQSCLQKLSRREKITRKGNNLIIHAAAMVLLTLAAACSHEDPFADGGDNDYTSSAPLGITVTDGGYVAAEAPDNAAPVTRAVERGYGTEFTAGDRVGLYAVELSEAGNLSSNRKFLHENLCLTYDGTAWTLPAGKELEHRPPQDGEIFYFAYYPYQDNMSDKVDIYAFNEHRVSTIEPRYFFRNLISSWSPAIDQSTYAAYTASDLMVSRGEVSKRTDGEGSVLRFTMEHQMALAVIRVPTTNYTYQGTVDGVPVEKSYRLYSGLDCPKYWMENNNTARILLNPSSPLSSDLNTFYYDSNLVKRKFAVSLDNDNSGTYYLCTVDGGEETVTERALKIGDYYMSDGTIIPQEHVTDAMPAEVKDNCIGVVYMVGDPTQNDRLLKRDHPTCTNGMALALKDISESIRWSDTTENVNEWTNFELSKDDRVDIREANTSKGYAKTLAIKAYNVKLPKEKVTVVEAVGQYSVPYPEGSSGWFLPDINDGEALNLYMDVINRSCAKVGDALDRGKMYWMCHEFDDNNGAVMSAGSVSDWYKQGKAAARAVLAF